MDPDPDPALLVFKDIYVVIAAAHRPELRPGHVAQRGQPPGRAVGTTRDLPGVIVSIVEKFVIDLFFQAKPKLIVDQTSSMMRAMFARTSAASASVSTALLPPPMS